MHRYLLFYIGSLYAVDKSKFKNCEETDFCNSFRKLAAEEYRQPGPHVSVERLIHDFETGDIIATLKRDSQMLDMKVC